MWSGEFSKLLPLTLAVLIEAAWSAVAEAAGMEVGQESHGGDVFGVER